MIIFLDLSKTFPALTKSLTSPIYSICWEFKSLNGSLSCRSQYHRAKRNNNNNENNIELFQIRHAYQFMFSKLNSILEFNFFHTVNFLKIHSYSLEI